MAGLEAESRNRCSGALLCELADAQSRLQWICFYSNPRPPTSTYFNTLYSSTVYQIFSDVSPNRKKDPSPLFLLIHPTFFPQPKRLFLLIHHTPRNVMTKDFYFQAADHLWNVLAEEKELPDAVRKLEGKELQEEKCILVLLKVFCWFYSVVYWFS